jgi:hypothetical protein
MEQLVRGSVPWAHPALQPRAPAWHKLSAASESCGLNRAMSGREGLDRVGTGHLGEGRYYKVHASQEAFGI